MSAYFNNPAFPFALTDEKGNRSRNLRDERMEWDDYISERIRGEMRAQGLTHEQLAQAWPKPDGNPRSRQSAEDKTLWPHKLTAEQVETLCTLLDRPIDYFLGNLPTDAELLEAWHALEHKQQAATWEHINEQRETANRHIAEWWESFSPE
jgi:hypothetical protein